MRDYVYLDGYLDELGADIYTQPTDAGHTRMAAEFIGQITSKIKYDAVLDLGCGRGFCAKIFREIGKKWTGVTLGEDYRKCLEVGLDVFERDFTFLNGDVGGQFDLLFSRHSLEHSPMPLLTLMEWYRVGQKYLAVVLPNPKHFLLYGKNHYSVMYDGQFRWLASRAGWKVIEHWETDQELRYLLLKSKKAIERPY